MLKLAGHSHQCSNVPETLSGTINSKNISKVLRPGQNSPVFPNKSGCLSPGTSPGTHRKAQMPRAHTAFSPGTRNFQARLRGGCLHTLPQKVANGWSVALPPSPGLVFHSQWPEQELMPYDVSSLLPFLLADTLIHSLHFRIIKTKTMSLGEPSKLQVMVPCPEKAQLFQAEDRSNV